MPANVETAVYSNTPAWHREGIVLDSNGEKGLTIEKALPASGLDWTVRKVPAYAPVSYVPDQETGLLIPEPGADLVAIENRYNVQRESDGKFLGTVGKTWEPTQNLEGFQVVQDLIEEAGGTAWIEAAGSLDGGRKVWVMVHLDDSLQIAGEEYGSWLTFINGHDGRTSVTALVHDERIVCHNTLDIAVGEATGKDGSGRIIRVRHTKKAADRIKEARAILGIRSQRLEELAKQGEWLVEQSIDEGEFNTFLDSLMPLPKVPEDKDTTPAYTMINNRRGLVKNTWTSSANLEPIRDTRWGALQAVIEYADHKRVFNSDESQLKAQFGLTSQATEIKDRAYKILKQDKLAAA
jgi:phage/plasmid-like protein (TIGR03299 family)